MGPDEIASLSPINFFQLSFECLRLPQSKGGPFKLTEKLFDRYKIPSTESLTGEGSFAEAAIGWDVDGLEALIHVQEPFIEASYPNVSSGDSVELFIDTRDIKTSGHNTRFCHHFFFFPEALDGRHAGELTRFRTEDSHELCDPNELLVKASIKKDSYTLQIFIPSLCLHGYDPEQYKRLGFTYRINHEGESQHFSVLTSEYQIEQQPSLWSSVKLSS